MDNLRSNPSPDPRAEQLLALLHARLLQRRRAVHARSALLALAALGITAWLALGVARSTTRPGSSPECAGAPAPVELPTRHFAHIQIVRNDPMLVVRWSIQPAGRIEAVGDQELRALLARSGGGVVRIAGRSQFIAYATPTR